MEKHLILLDLGREIYLKNIAINYSEGRAAIVFGKTFQEVKEWKNRPKQYESCYYSLSALPAKYLESTKTIDEQLALVETNLPKELHGGQRSYSGTEANMPEFNEWYKL